MKGKIHVLSVPQSRLILSSSSVNTPKLIRAAKQHFSHLPSSMDCEHLKTSPNCYIAGILQGDSYHVTGPGRRAFFDLKTGQPGAAPTETRRRRTRPATVAQAPPPALIGPFNSRRDQWAEAAGAPPENQAPGGERSEQRLQAEGSRGS